MPHYKFVVFTEPKPGCENEYNDWYSNVHLKDVLSADGFVAAQRFKLVEAGMNSQPASRYMAIYEIEADDPNAALDQLPAAAASGAMVMSNALDTAVAKTFLYQPITERISKG
jgi:hypothetical protein